MTARVQVKPLPLTRRQLAGLKRRYEEDEHDTHDFDVQVDRWLSFSAYPHTQEIAVNATETLLDKDQARRALSALEEAIEFMTCGPGEWRGEGLNRRWESALDQDGNDREPSFEGGS